MFAIELTAEEVKEYQRIWREVFGEDISEIDARLSGQRLVELYRIMAEHASKSGGSTRRGSTYGVAGSTS